jgi:hypothetical protein
VKVGDLVKCLTAGVVGLVVELRGEGRDPLVCKVLIGNKSWAFLPHQLELISEDR